MDDIPNSEGPDSAKYPAFSSGVADSLPLQGPSPQVDPMPYNGGDVGREILEEDLSGHWNVYVGVHMPHSKSRHKHRHKRRHSRRGHHSNGHDHHGNGHDHQDSSYSHHDDGHDSYLDDEQEVDGRATDTGVGYGHEHHSGPVKYRKSYSVPSYPQHAIQSQPDISIDPITPSDPCDRVKFILGDHDDQNDNLLHTDGGTHSLFTELEELKYDENEHRMEWKETARWVKFEEDVEEGGNKWSKPHVATLSLHSLFELRSCVFKGTVMLDVQAENLATISDEVLDNLVSTGQLQEECREKVRAALLQRHMHMNSKKDHSHGELKLLDHLKSLGEIARHNSKDLDTMISNSHGGSLLGSRSNSRRGSFMGDHSGLRNGSVTGSRLDDAEDVDSTQHTRKPDSNFMKKIPPGSEASNVLVGEVDFLTHPIIAFVRLARGVHLGDLTEVPIPTRFIFIMLGPTGHSQRYHEVGRSIATLMSDEVFHDVAYKARNRGDLMAGIDEFLDKVTVLPPGEWDPQIRLEPPSKVPSQANRRNTLQKPEAGQGQEMEPFKCKHCKSSKNNSNQIQWTKRPFRGVIDDIMRCYGMYRSDFRESFSLQSVASLILIYFASITLAFTFGAFLSDHTGNALGATETILAVGLGNLFYSIFSGQPLVVLGPTGPTLIFEQLLFQFCHQQSIPFLEFRVWVGLWSALFMLILVILNVSAITRLFTRFTEEIFTTLIGLIFMYEALSSLWKIHLNNPYSRWILYPTIERECDCFLFPDEESRHELNISNATRLGSLWDSNISADTCSGPLLAFVGRDCPTGYMNHYDIFLMSVILFFGTFLFCIYFKKIRNSVFLKSYIRVVLSDFAVFIAVVVWVVADVIARVNTPKLVVPNIFENGVYSQPNRSVFIDPLGNDLPSWGPGAALVPALLVTILLFMDQHITAIIVNRKDNKLKKKPGYHLDLFLIACLLFFFSIMGLPWVVGSTIVSISHVQSLFLYSAHRAPGERPKFIGVREQRVTLFLMAFMVSLSVMAYNVLKLLPLPVLYGLILYLGIASLYSLQFTRRLLLFFVPSKHRPDTKYLRQIPNKRIYIYTGIQIAFLLLLIAFQANLYLKAIFPIMIVALVIGRWLLGFAFSKHDLELLDDPIPDSLYCLRCRHDREQVKIKLSNIEDGSKDTVIDSYDSVDGVKQLDVVSVEPVGNGGMYGEVGGAPEKHDDSFNLTREVDQCDLWKNMVKHLDAPLPSPHVPHKQSSSINGVSGNGKMWCVTDSDYRELGTLEECDTDLETCPISASQHSDANEKEGHGRKEFFVFDNMLQGVTEVRTSSPLISSGSSSRSRRGRYDLGDHKESDEGVASDCLLSKYRITSV